MSSTEQIASARTGILHKPIFHILLIFILGLIAYSNTFDVPFHFDDTGTIVENYKLKDLNNFWPPSGSRWFGFLTFALNYHFGGLNTVGYHIVNLIIHILNAILVYWLVVLTFKCVQRLAPPLLPSPLEGEGRGGGETLNSEPITHNYLIALFSALIFISHPIQTQAVTYIVQRFTSLATMFYLLSLVMYIKARLNLVAEVEVKAKVKKFSTSTSTLTFYLLSLISAILAMKTKEISFTLPLIIVIYEFMFFKGKIKRRILYLIALLLTILIIPLSLVGIDKPLGDVIGELREIVQKTEEIPRWSYLFTQFRVIVTYIRLLFLPINQNLDYDYPIYHSFFNPEVFLSLFFLLLIFAFGIYLLYAKRFTLYASRFLAFGILWFFIALSVESSIIPIKDVIFEHRLYLPSVGAIIAFSIAVFYVLQFTVYRLRISTSYFPVPTSYFLLLSAIVIVLSIATYQRNIVWKDWVTLWEDVIQKSPRKGRAFNALGWHYLNTKNNTEAIEAFLEAINRHPFYAELYLDLATAYEHSGDLDKAIQAYQKAIFLGKYSGKDNLTAHVSLGTLLFIKGDLFEAKKEFEKVLSIDPANVVAHYRTGLIYRAYKNYIASIYHLKRAVSINPQYPLYRFQLGEVYLLAGQLKEAIEEFSLCLQLNPNDLIARELLQQAKQKIHIKN